MRTGPVLAVLLLTVSACAEPGSPGAEPADVTSASWELQAGSIDGEQVPMVDGYPITLAFAEDSLGGTAACNGYSGRYLMGREGSFTVEGLGQTEMACTPEETMVAERRYLDALARITWWTVEDGSLVLAGEGAELSYVELPPVPTADLIGTVWVLESLLQDDTAASVGGERATLELLSDGSLIGSTGCRTLTGSYMVRGAEVRVQELAAGGECPRELADQDSRVLSVIGDRFRVQIEGDAMTLTSAGDEGLVYRAER